PSLAFGAHPQAVIRSRREVSHGRGPSRISPALDGEAPGRVSSQHPEGRDVGTSGGPEARVDRGGGRRLAGSPPARRRERAPSASEGRRGAEGRAEQNAPTERGSTGARILCPA